MKKKIIIIISILIIILIIILKLFIFNKDSRGLYKINDSRSIYSDILNPKMLLDGKVVPVKEIAKTNCTSSCIYNYSEPIEILRDGGSKIYEYEVENEKYYLIECNKINSNYNNGKDVIISKDKSKLANWC